ncbi:MAG: GAF domain-containing protein, partial [Anaerolineae bacterium]|nr:GAF domain-containing protein [Anaerolineae bacterium]
GGLYLYRPDQDVLGWSMAVGPHLVPIGTVLHRGEGLSGEVWETGEPLIVDDYRHWEGRAAFCEGYPFGVVVEVPVRWGKEFLGVLSVLAELPHTFSPADAELLSLFAQQAAIAIQNARLFQAEQEQRELAEALEEAAAAVSSTLDLDQVLDRILEQVEQVVHGDVFNVMLVEENHARTVRWRGYERFDAGEFISTVAFPIPETPTLQQMVETGKPVIIPDTGAAPNWVTLPALEWLRSYVAAPIQVTGLTIGFLNVDGTRPDQFGLADARRLEAFASHAATAIENAQLYQRLQGYAGQLEQRVQERTAELQAQYAWLDAILHSTTDGIVVTNEKGSIAHANPVAQAWLTQTLSPEEAGRLREAIRSVVTRVEEQPVKALELTGLDLELSAALVVEEG